MNTLCLVWGLYVLMDVTLGDERKFRIYFEEFTIKYKDPDLFEKLESTLTQRDNRSFVNAEMILTRNVTDVGVHTSMDFWKPNTHQKKKMYDIRVDACPILRRVQNNKFFNLYIKSFKRHVNFNLACPLKSNHSYKLMDWYLDEMDLPHFIPIGVFRTVTEYFTMKKMVISIVAKGQCISKV
ncbi:hypothetical protein KR067_010360 [Drosophila pandora]|nr:hypothetical protein KR067_010360 [Drosophila pandora]